MKTGNKALLTIAAALASYLLVGLLFVPRAAKVQDDSATAKPVVAEDDSLSFAVGMLVARDTPRAIKELGISDAEIGDFVKGLTDAFPVDGSPQAIAYARGVVIGATAMEMLEEAEYLISLSDTTKKVSKQMFLEGVKATVVGDGFMMTLDQAYNYYNGIVFRRPSEEFIAKNALRNGIETLPGGVQVKIERAGTGETASLRSTVGYIYKASYINGKLAESSRGEVVEAVVGSLSSGLVQVFTTLPVGTKCKAYIPWQLAYGARGSNNVPPYSARVYDIEIVEIVKK